MTKQPRLPQISDAEWLVMRVLWDKAPQTANDVVAALEPHVHWKPKTVMTLLNRLVKKGALDYNKQGRAYHYFPQVREAACVRAESRSFLQRVYGGSLLPMLAHFLDEERLSPREIAELKRLLDAKEKK